MGIYHELRSNDRNRKDFLFYSNKIVSSTISVWEYHLWKKICIEQYNWVLQGFLKFVNGVLNFPIGKMTGKIYSFYVSVVSVFAPFAQSMRIGSLSQTN